MWSKPPPLTLGLFEPVSAACDVFRRVVVSFIRGDWKVKWIQTLNSTYIYFYLLVKNSFTYVYALRPCKFWQEAIFHNLGNRIRVSTLEPSCHMLFWNKFKKLPIPLVKPSSSSPNSSWWTEPVPCQYKCSLTQSRVNQGMVNYHRLNSYILTEELRWLQ